MTKNSHDHSKREELGHSLKILGQSKRETQQGKNPNAATPCLMSKGLGDCELPTLLPTETAPPLANFTLCTQLLLADILQLC